MPILRSVPFLIGLQILGISLAWPAAGALAQSSLKERFLFASVLDKDKKPVPSLQPEDLIVREDGQAREILRIVPATEPLQVALLLDNSQAATARIQRMREAVTAFVNRVANGTNEVSMVTIADRPTLRVDATTDAKTLLKKGVDGFFAQPGSGMYLQDAIIETTKGFKKKEAQRPVIVAVLTEGVEFSQSHYDTVIDALKDSGTQFYALVLTDGAEANPTADEIRSRNIVLDRGTKETGGRRETLITEMALKDNLMSVAEELLKQYKVTYSRPDTLIPPKQTMIEAKAAGVTARGTISGPRDGRGSK